MYSVHRDRVRLSARCIGAPRVWRGDWRACALLVIPTARALDYTHTNAEIITHTFTQSIYYLSLTPTPRGSSIAIDRCPLIRE